MLKYPPVFPFNQYRLLIAAGETDGVTDFFAGIDLTSLLNRNILIRNIKFIPRFIQGDRPQLKEQQFLDETGAGNNYDLVSPNAFGVGLRTRIVTANVEYKGIKLDFRYNGIAIQLVDGMDHFLNFDYEFKNVNLYLQKLQSFYLTADELIYIDVVAPISGTYLLQVNFDLIIEPSKQYLQNLFG